jgi:hypothetical protein
MAVLVTLLAVVLALLALLVAGLLRSHAEILRALHGMGIDMDPARDGDDDAPTTAVGAPTIRRSEVPRRSSREAADVAGLTPSQDALSIAVTGVGHFTLLAFLSSGCGPCLNFWDEFRDGDPLEIPGDARLVCVSKGPEEESVASIQRLAADDVATVMSSDAWSDYDVPVAPYFVLVDGPSGHVVGEGAANEWSHVASLLHSALDDAGMLDRKGRVKAGARMRADAEVLREQRADRDLLAAGIQPGDSSLYVFPEDAQGIPRPSDAADAPDVRQEREERGRA